LLEGACKPNKIDVALAGEQKLLKRLLSESGLLKLEPDILITISRLECK